MSSLISLIKLGVALSLMVREMVVTVVSIAGEGGSLRNETLETRGEERRVNVCPVSGVDRMTSSAGCELATGEAPLAGRLETRHVRAGFWRGRCLAWSRLGPLAIAECFQAGLLRADHVDILRGRY